METLLQIPGIQQIQPFHFLDSNHQPTKCNLLVHPAQGWAIATELHLAGQTPIQYCALTLASKVCQEFSIDPTALALFSRYDYGEVASYYVLHFVHGGPDLFFGISFLGPLRDVLPQEQAEQLFQQLAAGQQPAPELRALRKPIINHLSSRRTK